MSESNEVRSRRSPSLNSLFSPRSESNVEKPERSPLSVNDFLESFIAKSGDDVKDYVLVRDTIQVVGNSEWTEQLMNKGLSLVAQKIKSLLASGVIDSVELTPSQIDYISGVIFMAHQMHQEIRVIDGENVGVWEIDIDAVRVLAIAAYLNSLAPAKESGNDDVQKGVREQVEGTLNG
jgi:hypothetical protein